jgi:hypothetical protein
MTTTFDQSLERIEAGGFLTAEEIHALSSGPDILQLGMLADALRRRLHGTRTTYLRVASCPFDRSFADAVPPAAREISITGVPDSLAVAVSAIRSAKAVAGQRTVSAFSWRDVQRLATGKPHGIPHVLDEMRGAGLDALADLPLDIMTDASRAIERLVQAGFARLRLTYDGAEAVEPEVLWTRASELQGQSGAIQAICPLPATTRTMRPTTGYADVRAVAIARLAAPNIPNIQVDWSRHGPKLAQVALTFGADDIWGVSASDASPEGRRRAPVEEIRRNVEAAGFEAVERDGRVISAS